MEIHRPVVFANNPLSGVLIAVALTIANPEASLAGLVTASVGLLVSMAVRQDPVVVCSGQTVFNALLIGLVTASTLPTKYGLQMDVLTWLFMLVATVLSVYITSAVSSILHSVGPYPAPSFTVPFNIVQLLLFTCVINKPHHIQLAGGVTPANVSALGRASSAEIAYNMHLTTPREHLDPVAAPEDVPDKYTEFIDHEAWRGLYVNVDSHGNANFSTYSESGEDLSATSANPLGVRDNTSGNTHSVDNSTSVYEVQDTASDDASLLENSTSFYTETQIHQNLNSTTEIKEDPNITYHVDRNSSYLANYDDSSTEESRVSKMRQFPAVLDVQNESYANEYESNYDNSTNTEEILHNVNHPVRVTASNYINTGSRITYLPEESSSDILQNESYLNNEDMNSSHSAIIATTEIPENVTHLPVIGNATPVVDFNMRDPPEFSAVSESLQEVNSSHTATEAQSNYSYYSTNGAYTNEFVNGKGESDLNGTLERSRRSADDRNSTSEYGNNTITGSHHDVDWGQVFAGVVLSSSQVYGLCDAPASATIYLAILVFSPTMAAFSAAGALVGTLTGLVLSSPPYTDVYAGEWGMQGLLCAAALGGFCYVITVQSAVAALLCSLLGAVLKHALSASYAAANLPIMSMPFNVAAILFLYITSVSDEDFVQPEVLSFPEKHWFDYRQQHSTHGDQGPDTQHTSDKEGTAEENKKLQVSRDDVA